VLRAAILSGELQRACEYTTPDKVWYSESDEKDCHKNVIAFPILQRSQPCLQLRILKLLPLFWLLKSSA